MRELVDGHPTLLVVAEALLTARAALVAQLKAVEKRLVGLARHDTRARPPRTRPGLAGLVAGAGGDIEVDDLGNQAVRLALAELLLKRVSGERSRPAEEPPCPSPIAPLPPAARLVKQEPRFPLADHDLPQPDRAFVGRTAELAALRKALTAGGRTAITQPHAITGLE